jgi:hypothetical protein
MKPKKVKTKRNIKLRLPPEFYFCSKKNRVIKNKKKEKQKKECRIKQKDEDLNE